MDEVANIYRVTGPTSWPEEPRQFSFSSLRVIESCPLQWQLTNANYGTFERFPVRPHPAAVEGTIIHEVLDRLFRCLGLAGLPPVGSKEFRQAMTEFDVRQEVKEQVARHEEKLHAHPRGSMCRLQSSSEQLVNRVVRLFRAEYSGAGNESPVARAVASFGTRSRLDGASLLALLKDRGALSELKLAHPKLPLGGVIDLAKWSDAGAEILDFKTGGEKTEHLDQVLLYGVLWWRTTGAAPSRVGVRYPTGQIGRDIGIADLETAERKLDERIRNVCSILANPPAAAKIAGQCHYCGVRQFCDRYWQQLADNRAIAKGAEAGSLDAEVAVKNPPSPSGFEGEVAPGKTLNVVYPLDAEKVHGPFVAGEKIRILNGKAADKGETIELAPWTEVFHLGVES